MTGKTTADCLASAGNRHATLAPVRRLLGLHPAKQPSQKPTQSDVHSFTAPHSSLPNHPNHGAISVPQLQRVRGLAGLDGCPFQHRWRALRPGPRRERAAQMSGLVWGAASKGCEQICCVIFASSLARHLTLLSRPFLPCLQVARAAWCGFPARSPPTCLACSSPTRWGRRTRPPLPRQRQRQRPARRLASTSPPLRRTLRPSSSASSLQSPLGGQQLAASPPGRRRPALSLRSPPLLLPWPKPAPAAPAWPAQLPRLLG